MFTEEACPGWLSLPSLLGSVFALLQYVFLYLDYPSTPCACCNLDYSFLCSSRPSRAGAFFVYKILYCCKYMNVEGIAGPVVFPVLFPWYSVRSVAHVQQPHSIEAVELQKVEVLLDSVLVELVYTAILLRARPTRASYEELLR